MKEGTKGRRNKEKKREEGGVSLMKEINKDERGRKSKRNQKDKASR